MITCIKCEVIRARLIAAPLWLLKTEHEIVTILNLKFGDKYYSEGQNIYRHNQTPPNTPYKIL